MFRVNDRQMTTEIHGKSRKKYRGIEFPESWQNTWAEEEETSDVENKDAKISENENNSKKKKRKRKTVELF